MCDQTNPLTFNLELKFFMGSYDGSRTKDLFKKTTSYFKNC
jgi:hypothetical protein